MTNNDLSSSQRFGDSENTSEFTDLESEKLLEKIRENSKFFNNGILSLTPHHSRPKRLTF